jgi:hypothetical protein
VLIPLMIYRRLRRSFGRQPLRPTRMTVRMIILGLLAVSLVPLLIRATDFLLAGVAGIVLGLGLALWGASRTRFLTQGGQLFYVPHTYAGIVVSLLVIGRLAYRLPQVFPGLSPTAPPQAGSAQVVQSPLTVGILFVLIGYYVCYYGWLLWKSRHVTPEDIEPAVAASAADAPAQGGNTPG